LPCPSRVRPSRMAGEGHA